MATISYKDFISYVLEWGEANVKAIASKWPQKGGWEGWAQAEIYSYILQINNTYDILREQAVYTSKRKAADFLFNSMTSGAQSVIVELKCQSFENYQNFVPGIEDDVKKLIHELKPAYKGSVLVVLGIYFTEHTRTQIPDYFNKKVLKNGEVGICWAVDLNS
ncbi:MAG: hypothetical protein O9276_07795 [Microcystis sp. LE17-20A]|jgi:hypothetical protein|uniref:hypothetical protein n=1 Tax=unclassified Microcystis TaxID=2643300 RepID=UPI0022BF10A7|nr:MULTISPECIES: hypothetical protein [unclassified Microcystis]MCZ8038021.1 hypothetical protein [Microcystis sp. LE17-20A]MCZ8212766.1 hypothetical protein [Microcystis sp. LE19-8.1F]